MTVSTDEVLWCYRLLLGREPESAAVTAEHCTAANLQQLVQTIYQSEECQRVAVQTAIRRLRAFDTQSVRPGEIYRGWLEEDRQRLAALAALDTPAAVEGFYVDCFGHRFHPGYQQAIRDRLGQVSDLLPLPGDRHLSEGIEYAAAALALEAAQGQDTFCAVELGAGFGPWTAFFGLMAGRLGFQHIHLAAFEADAGRFAQLRSHLAHNGVVAADAPAQGHAGAIHWQLHQAAAWWQHTTLRWPANDNPLDAGMRAETADRPLDYRGRETHYTDIPALDVAEALQALPAIDLLHIDIQGSEAVLVPKLLGFMQTRVRAAFIGTHSRQIEGDLMTLLYDAGWQLLREKPCRFDCRRSADALDGRTTADGGQYWVNPALQHHRRDV